MSAVNEEVFTIHRVSKM